MLRKDSVGNQAWYTSDTGNREQAGTITAASTSGPQFVSKYDASNYSSFQTNASGDLTITPTGENTSVVSDISVNGTLTINPGGQAFKIGNRGNSLYFQSQTNDISSYLEVFSKRGDGGDNVGLILWGYGTPGSVDDKHHMVNGYYASGGYYRSYIDHAGTQTAKEYRLFTNDHTGQLVLKTDGSVSMSGALDVFGNATLGNASADAHTVNGTLTINPGVQAFKIGNRGSTLYFQSQTNDVASILGIFSKRGDGGDNVRLSLWGYGTPESVDDRHRMIAEFDASGDYYRSYIDHSGTQTAKEYRLYTNGHTGQLVLDTAGSVSMSGALDVGGGINASESAFSVKEATGHGVTSFLDTNTYIKIDHDSTVGKIKGI
ncbi:MAG TPA: hypothetical protein VKP88_03445, partial [Candidatus Paceibacterota bacterium]|nr:hypothetical protein [Candidatus Paceibacterota bacterium]